MAIYLKFVNTKGIAPTEGHASQIVVLLKTFALSMSREITMEAGQPCAGEWASVATITKAADRAVTALLKEALAAGQALFVTVVPARDQVQDVLTYKLSSCILDKYDLSTHDVDHPIETLELRFSAMESEFHHSRHQQKRQPARRSL